MIAKIRIILVVLLALVSFSVTLPTVPVHAAPPANAPFNYVVTILMENNGYCDVITACGGTGTYETSLANTYALAGTCQSDSSCSVGGYTACCHNSQGNYVALLAGGSNINSNTLPDGYCCFNVNAPNLVDRIESGGLTWQAWAEDGSGSGCSYRPPRSADHYPFISFTNMNTAARCANFHNTSGSNDNTFIAALTTGSASNLMWLTPNDNNNGHDTGVSGGDSWLSGIVPRILASPLFSNSANKAALIVLYDEGNAGCGGVCNTSTNDFIYVSWSGTPVKHGYIGTGHYTHASWAKTMESAWGLTCIGNTPLGAEQSDCNALAMSEFFGPSTQSGNFDNTWYIQNCPGGTETISNGVLQTREVTPGGSSNSYGFCTAQRGSFPWGSTVGTTLPTGITSVSVSLTFLARTLSSGSRYHLYIALYYQIPSSTAGGKTYTWLDTQSRAENINGANTAIGFTETYDPGDSFGWDKVTLQINPGQSGNITADEVGLAQGDLAAWGLPGNTPFTLRGVEIGSEGFLIPQIDADWFIVTFATGGPPPPPPTLTADYSFTPASPIVGQTISFTSIVTGGTFPFAYSWNFGDSQTSTAQNPLHSYSLPNTYTVVLTVTDAGSPQQTATRSRPVQVSPQPPTPDFSISASPNSQSFIAGNTGHYTVVITSINGFSGTVVLTEAPSPSGLTTSCSPSSITSGAGSSSCVLNSNSPNTYTIVVTGTSGSLSHSVNVFATVLAVPDYTISANPSSLTKQQSSTGTSTITLVSINAFSGTVSLTSFVTPNSGPSSSLSPIAVTLSSGGSGSSTLTIVIGAATPVANYNITVTGASGSISHSTVVALSVFALPPPPPPPPNTNPSPPACAACAAGPSSTPFDTGVVGIAVTMTVIAMAAVVFQGFKNSRREE